MNDTTQADTLSAPLVANTDAPLLPVHGTSTTALVLDGQAFQQIMEVAKIMAGGRATLPKHLQGNTADCMAVIMQAMQWKMNPFAVAQKTHLVNGTLGYEAQLVNAVITSLAPTTGRIQYEWYGDWSKVIGKFKEGESKKVDEDTGEKKKYRVPSWTMQDEQGLGVKVWATMKGETEPRMLDLQLIQARVRNSTLWADDPKQQLAYLAVKRWSRLHCPDVILGVYTPDELDEGRAEPKDVSPTTTTRPADIGAASVPRAEMTDEIRQVLERLEKVAKDQGEEALGEQWAKLTPQERKAIGADGLRRLKELATAEDATYTTTETQPGTGDAQ